MDHLGVNIYYWGAAEQRRLLLGVLRPCALDARRQGITRRFWYCCFDARGPHIFALFTTAGEQARLRDLLERRLQAFLQETPSRAALGLGELERRHAECRGKTLSAADRGDDLAANNSYVFFSQPGGGYPLWMDSGMSAADEFWRQLDDLTFWTLEHLERGSHPAMAIHWLAAVDHALHRLGQPAEAYWRFHAETLLPALSERLAIHGDEVLVSLPGVLSERNHWSFSKAWNEEGEFSLGFDVDRMIEVVMRDDGRSLRQRLRVLREVNHGTLGQLHQPVRFHVPLVLYAWQRNLVLSPKV